MRKRNPKYHGRVSGQCCCLGGVEAMIRKLWIKAQKPITLVEHQAFLKLHIKERRKIMGKQAREMAPEYKEGKVEDLEQ